MHSPSAALIVGSTLPLIILVSQVVHISSSLELIYHSYRKLLPLICQEILKIVLCEIDNVHFFDTLIIFSTLYNITISNTATYGLKLEFMSISLMRGSFRAIPFAISNT